jgi:hypothetical protein
MRKTAFAALALVAFNSPAFAASPAKKPPTLSELAARIESLEADAKQLREQAASALAAAESAHAELEALKAQQLETANNAPAAAEVAAEPTAATGSNANAFNPAISVILNGSYEHHSVDPDNYVRSGFPAVEGAGPGPQGISLGESEITLSANIDEKFYGQLTASVESEHGEDHLGIEEAYIDTTTLPNGFNLRAGRFFSGIGYLNGHHAHTDNFSDRPLAYQSFLGGQYGDDGLQLRWLAPTDTYLEIGGELFAGNPYPSSGGENGGVGTRTLFAHLGGDVGVENSWLAGVSVLQTKSAGGEDGFTGNTTLYVADATWKWAPNGNTKDGGWTLRGEYLVDDRDGVVADAADPSILMPWNGRRRGGYVEAVYRFNRSWDAGYRYDKLWAADAGPFASEHDPVRNSFTLTWRNSEFSLVRLMFSRDEPNALDIDNALYLQYQVSLGAHGAHKF